MVTRDEELVVQRVDDSMWVNEITKKIHVSYLWKNQANLQTSNKR